MAIELLDVDVTPNADLLALDNEYVSPRNAIYVHRDGEFQKAKATYIFRNGRWVMFWNNEWLTTWMTTVTLEVPVSYVSSWMSTVNHQRSTTRVSKYNTTWRTTYVSHWTVPTLTGKWESVYVPNGAYGYYTNKWTQWYWNKPHSATVTAERSRGTSKEVSYNTYWSSSFQKSKLTEKITKINTSIEVSRWTKH